MVFHDPSDEICMTVITLSENHCNAQPCPVTAPQQTIFKERALWKLSNVFPIDWFLNIIVDISQRHHILSVIQN